MLHLTFHLLCFECGSFGFPHSSFVQSKPLWLFALLFERSTVALFRLLEDAPLPPFVDDRLYRPFFSLTDPPLKLDAKLSTAFFAPTFRVGSRDFKSSFSINFLFLGRPNFSIIPGFEMPCRLSAFDFSLA